VDTVRTGTWDDIAPDDRGAFGADRGRLLRAMIDDAAPPFVAGGPNRRVAGYALGRPGTRAGYVGPVVADEASTARTLILAAAAGLGETVFLDVDPAFPGAVDLMSQLGFARQRELLRMRLGPDIAVGTTLRVFAIAGPEVG
jgi:hypothetical protein